MHINILAIPKALMQFFIGVFINVIIYYVFSPYQGNLMGVLSDTTETAVSGSPIYIMWLLLFIFCIIINLALPAWTILGEEEDDEKEHIEIS